MKKLIILIFIIINYNWSFNPSPPPTYKINFIPGDCILAILVFHYAHTDPTHDPKWSPIDTRATWSPAGGSAFTLSFVRLNPSIENAQSELNINKFVIYIQSTKWVFC